MFAFDRVIDKRRETVAAAQVFFGSGSVGSRAFRELHFLVWTQLEPESFDDPLHDRVLDADYVAGVSVDAFTPQNLAGAHVEQLRRHAQAIPSAQERRRENRVDS